MFGIGEKYKNLSIHHIHAFFFPIICPTVKITLYCKDTFYFQMTWYSTIFFLNKFSSSSQNSHNKTLRKPRKSFKQGQYSRTSLRQHKPYNKCLELEQCKTSYAEGKYQNRVNVATTLSFLYKF